MARVVEDFATVAEARTPADPASAEDLEAGYEVSHRVYELCGIFATVTTGIWLFARLVAGGPLPLWWIPIATVLGMLAADLVSGLVHWGFDTWGGLDTPVVGKLAIRTFRHHHIDPRAMLRHDFVETNGHNFTLSLTLTTGGLWALSGQGASDGARFLCVFLLAMAVFVSLTSQIHKWAHSPTPPRLVAQLQRAGLLLSPQHHQRHHDAPHTDAYCITLGWMDPVLDGLRSFRLLEAVIQRVTGHVPRRDG